MGERKGKRQEEYWSDLLHVLDVCLAVFAVGVGTSLIAYDEVPMELYSIASAACHFRLYYKDA